MNLSVPWRWWGVLGWNRFCPCSWLAWYCGLSFAYSYPGSCCPLWVCLDLIAVAAFYTVPVFLLADALLQFVVQFWLVSIWICLMLDAGQFIAHAWLLPTWPNWQPCSKHLSKSTCLIFHLNMAIASWWRHQAQFTHRMIWYVRKYSQGCSTVMQVENGLVETIAVLISKMPRLRPSLPPGSPGQAFNFKPEFTKASARWLWTEDHGT